MAVIISRNGVKLFISFSPGTGSTSLEQYFRTYDHCFRREGLGVVYVPEEEFGEGGKISRHICYEKYRGMGGLECNYVATGVRHPISYYQSEYSRCRAKWNKLLDNKRSWIYHEDSQPTLHLVRSSLECESFDEWFRLILYANRHVGWMVINGDHLVGVTHVIRNESLYSDLQLLIKDILNIDIYIFNVDFPRVNVGVSGCNFHLTEEAKILARELFYHYNKDYRYEIN